MTCLYCLSSQAATGVSQHGITFTFDADYPVGQYVNGDWYVLAPSGLTITYIDPAPLEGRNGVMVNPSSQSQAFDDRASNYDAELLLAFPYAASPGDSVVAATSDGHFVGTADIRYDELDRSVLETAAVLTVVSIEPSELSYRPPYVGTDKPTHAVAEVDWSLLPSLSSSTVTDIPTLVSQTRRVERLQLDHIYNPGGQSIHPTQHMPAYGGYAISTLTPAITRMLMDDPIEDRMPIAHGLIQYGIDSYWAILNAGTRWVVNGGHNQGRKNVIVFAAVMLTDSAMQAQIREWANVANPANVDLFQDDWGWQYMSEARLVVWGEQGVSESTYWDNQLTGSGLKTAADTYGWIDGGMSPGGSYQAINGPPALSYSLLGRYLPGYEAVWNNPSLSRGDREWNFGTWTLPDPYQSKGSGLQDGVGRYPGKHRSLGYNNAYRGGFVESVANAYLPPAVFMPHISPYNTEEATTATVTLERFKRQTPAGYPNYWDQYPDQPIDGEYPYLDGITIRYTVDGSEPDEYSSLYSGPFTVGLSNLNAAGYAVVKAKAYKSGWEPSATNTSWIRIRPYVEQAATSNSGGGSVTSRTATFAEPPQPGNIIIAVASMRSRSTTLTFDGSGWNYILQHDSAPSSAIAWKIAGSLESQSVTVQANTSSQRMAISITEITGIEGFEASIANKDKTSSSPSKSSGNLSISNSLPRAALAIWAGDDAGSVITSANFSNGYEPVVSAITSPSDGGYRSRIYMAVKNIDNTESPESFITVDASSLRGIGALVTFAAGETAPPSARTSETAPPSAPSALTTQ